MLHTQCPICSGGTLARRFIVDGYTIVKCAACSFVFVQEKLSDSDLAQIYGPQDPDSVYDDPANIDNLNFYYLLLKDRIEKRVPAGRILDVGCSEGQFLETMSGWDCYGTELARKSYLVACEKFGSDRVIPATISDTKFADQFFDVIALQDVFDHMPDPLAALRDCLRLLRPGGLLVIKVHNIACLYARLTGPRFYAIIPPYHLSYFSPQTLRLALEKTGFEFSAHEFLPHLLFLQTVFLRLASNRKEGVYHGLYRALSGTRVGRIRIRKNLHDIVTVFARAPMMPAGCDAGRSTRGPL